MTDDAGLTDRLKAEARRLGFDQVGIAPAVAPGDYPRYLDWLQAGHAAGMDYLRRQAEARAHPDYLLEGARSIVVVSLVYGGNAPETAPSASNPPRSGPLPPCGGGLGWGGEAEGSSSAEAPGRSPSSPPQPSSAGGEGVGGDRRTRAKVARYAQGGDYHEVLWRRLEALLDWLRGECPTVRGRAVADTAPLLERDAARRAGLGWIGKNTMLIDRRLGSYTVLGALLVDLALRPDAPHESSHCGTCTRCLDACPTDAFAGPYELDASRCLSYWTIEHKGPIADEYADRLGDQVFGCDICQEVCPWNRKAPPGRDPALAARPEWTDPDLLDWLTAEPATFRRALKGTALARAKRSGLLRNAAHVLGARGVAEAAPALAALLDDPDPVIRDAAAWALGRIATAEAVAALEARRVPDSIPIAGGTGVPPVIGEDRRAAGPTGI